MPPKNVAQGCMKIPKQRLENALQAIEENKPFVVGGCTNAIHTYDQMEEHIVRNPRDNMYTEVNMNLVMDTMRNSLLRRDWVNLARCLQVAQPFGKTAAFLGPTLRYAIICLAVNGQLKLMDNFVHSVLNTPADTGPDAILEYTGFGSIAKIEQKRSQMTSRCERRKLNRQRSANPDKNASKEKSVKKKSNKKSDVQESSNVEQINAQHSPMIKAKPTERNRATENSSNEISDGAANEKVCKGRPLKAAKKRKRSETDETCLIKTGNSKRKRCESIKSDVTIASFELNSSEKKNSDRNSVCSDNETASKKKKNKMQTKAAMVQKDKIARDCKTKQKSEKDETKKRKTTSAKKKKSKKSVYTSTDSDSAFDIVYSEKSSDGRSKELPNGDELSEVSEDGDAFFENSLNKNAIPRNLQNVQQHEHHFSDDTSPYAFTEDELKPKLEKLSSDEQSVTKPAAARKRGESKQKVLQDAFLELLEES